jgi:hypothetical protein
MCCVKLRNPAPDSQGVFARAETAPEGTTGGRLTPPLAERSLAAMVNMLLTVRATRISSRIVLGRPVVESRLAAKMRAVDHVLFESHFG